MPTPKKKSNSQLFRSPNTETIEFILKLCNETKVMDRNVWFSLPSFFLQFYAVKKKMSFFSKNVKSDWSKMQKHEQIRDDMFKKVPLQNKLSETQWCSNIVLKSFSILIHYRVYHILTHFAEKRTETVSFILHTLYLYGLNRWNRNPT